MLESIYLLTFLLILFIKNSPHCMCKFAVNVMIGDLFAFVAPENLMGHRQDRAARRGPRGYPYPRVELFLMQGPGYTLVGLCPLQPGHIPKILLLKC